MMFSFVLGLMGAPGTSAGLTTVILTLDVTPGADSNWVASLLKASATPCASSCARWGEGSVTLIFINEVSRGALALTLPARAPGETGRFKSWTTLAVTVGLETKLT